MPDKKNPPWWRTLCLDVRLANTEVHRDFKSHAQVYVIRLGPHSEFLRINSKDKLILWSVLLINATSQRSMADTMQRHRSANNNAPTNAPCLGLYRPETQIRPSLNRLYV